MNSHKTLGKFTAFGLSSLLCEVGFTNIYLLGLLRRLLIKADSLAAQGKRICLPMKETQVGSLGRGDSLEKEMEPTPGEFSPGEFHRQRSLVVYSPWCLKEPDTT